MKITEHIIIRVFVQLPGSTMLVLPRLMVYNNVVLTYKASEEIKKVLKIAVLNNTTVD